MNSDPESVIYQKHPPFSFDDDVYVACHDDV